LDKFLHLLFKLGEIHRQNPKLRKLIIFFTLYVLYGCYKKICYPPKSLEDKVILITGGVSGIGRLVALKLKKYGAKVIVWDVNDAGIKEMSQHVDSSVKCNVSDKQDVMEKAEQLLNEFNRLDILINNAGIVSGKKLLQLNEKQIRKTFDVNVIAHFWTVQAFLPQMLKNKEGHIVTICSTAGKSGVSHLVDYCASKYACRGFDNALRQELQDLGHIEIVLTNICPYFINTGMFDGAKDARNLVVKYFAYFLEPDHVAHEIVESIRYNKREITLPNRLGYLYYLEPILPWWMGDALIRNASDMSTFRGRDNHSEHQHLHQSQHEQQQQLQIQQEPEKEQQPRGG